MAEKTTQPSFWKQMIMSKQQNDEIKKLKEEVKRTGTSVVSKTSGYESKKVDMSVVSRASNMLEPNPPETDHKSNRPKSPITVASSRAVQEWERRKQVRIESNKDRRQKLKTTPVISASTQKYKMPKKTAERNVTGNSNYSSPKIVRPSTAPRETVPIVTLKKPKHIIGQPLRKYDDVYPDPFAELLDFKDKQFIWPQTSQISGHISNGHMISASSPDFYNDFDSESDSDGEVELSRPGSAHSRFDELEALVSSAAGDTVKDRTKLQAYLPDPHVVPLENEIEDHDVATKHKEVAFKTLKRGSVHTLKAHASGVDKHNPEKQKDVAYTEKGSPMSQAKGKGRTLENGVPAIYVTDENNQQQAHHTDVPGSRPSSGPSSRPSSRPSSQPSSQPTSGLHLACISTIITKVIIIVTIVIFIIISFLSFVT